MTILELHNTFIKFNVIESERQSIVRKNLVDTCSYEVSGARFSKQYQRGLWNGRKSIIIRNNIPTGLFSIVVGTLNQINEPYQVIDKRIKPKNGTPLSFLGEMRDYQNIDAEMEEKQRGMLIMSVGAGKTAVMSKFMGRINRPTLCIVPSKDLADQNAEEFNKFLGIKCGVLHGKKKQYDEFFTVATIQTLWRNRQDERVRNLLDNVDVLLMDEADFAGSDSYYNICMSCNAYYRWALTGTLRDDGKNIKMQGCTGKILYNIDTSFLIEKKVLSKTRVHIKKLFEGSSVATADYTNIYKEAIQNNDYRNNMIKDIALREMKNQKRIAIVVTNIEHGEILNQLIPNSVYLNGGSQDRRRYYNDLNDGKINCIITTKILERGVNIPNLNVLIVARAGASARGLVQLVGRVVRKGEDEIVDVYDFYDGFNRVLEKQSKTRLSTYKKEREFIVKMEE